MWIYVKKQNADSTIDPNALKEEYFVLKELEKIEEVDASACFADFVNLICLLEFNKTLSNCLNKEITTAYQDLLFEKSYDEIKMMNVDDPNEKVDYNPYPRISKGKTIDSIDLKNYFIQEKDGKICGYSQNDRPLSSSSHFHLAADLAELDLVSVVGQIIILEDHFEDGLVLFCDLD